MSNKSNKAVKTAQAMASVQYSDAVVVESTNQGSPNVTIDLQMASVRLFITNDHKASKTKLTIEKPVDIPVYAKTFEKAIKTAINLAYDHLKSVKHDEPLMEIGKLKMSTSDVKKLFIKPLYQQFTKGEFYEIFHAVMTAEVDVDDVKSRTEYVKAFTIEEKKSEVTDVTEDSFRQAVGSSFEVVGIRLERARAEMEKLMMTDEDRRFVEERKIDKKISSGRFRENYKRQLMLANAVEEKRLLAIGAEAGK